MLDYIDSKIGDHVNIPLDFSSFLGDYSLTKLLALMVHQVDGMYVDYRAQELRYNDGKDLVPLSHFGSIFDDVDFTLNIDYTISSTF